ncbi:MAG: potassium channel protein [Acidobacteriia bacterium]|nr:potassium channel protein [Terriglobia bacterium]
MNLRKQLMTAVLVLLVVVMVTAAGYRILGGPHISLLDAIYMAVITFATIGYGEVVDTSVNPALRIFNMVMILFGIGTMLYVFSISTAFVVEGELKDIFRRRKMLKQIRDMQDHFIICGASETAYHVVQELLKTGHPFVVIDHDAERLARIQHLGEFPVLQGEAADEEVLEQAGIARAHGLAIVLPDDKDNLMVTVTARQMSPTVRIIARCTDARMGEKMVRAGASSAVSPNMIGGMRMASELIRPHVVGFLDLMLREKSKTLRVEEIAVGESSSWAGKTLHESEIHRRFELLALAVRDPRGETRYNPQGDTVLKAGDVLIVMGDVSNVRKAREEAK